MKNTTIPTYMSSPPKEMDRSPYRIASLASTMPPRKEDVLPPPKEPSPEPPKPPAKNFFMDIYAQEVNKMKSESTSAPVSKKRNFDATHFNAYGLPLARPCGVFPLYLPTTSSSGSSSSKPSTSIVNVPIAKTKADHRPQVQAPSLSSQPGPLRRCNHASRRSSGSSLTGKDELSTRPLSEARPPPEPSLVGSRKFSLGNIRSRSSSTEFATPPGGSMPLPILSKESLSSSEQKKKDEEKTFSVTILVNENEKK